MQMTGKTLALPLLFLGIFYSIAAWCYIATGKIFFLINFGYIGTALALGLFLAGALPKDKFQLVRRTAQLLIGGYLLVYVGIIERENIQIEGFWFYLFSGIFAGATLHYFIAKILGPFVFNRGWCGWACWTAMFLDLLPWRKPRAEINRKWALVRYAVFLLGLIACSYVFFIVKDDGITDQSARELSWLLIGSISYYVLGTLLAALLKDNRAFCKYVCPISVLMKVGSRFALLKMKIDKEKCIRCGVCESNCPMQVKITKYLDGNCRVRSSECIVCNTCSSVCPRNALGFSFGIDKSERSYPSSGEKAQ